MYHGERFNSISHLLGAIAGVCGMIFLSISAARDGDIWKIVSFNIYGATLIFLYLASTLYHSFKGRTKRIFLLLDYLGIYLLIAGTYTPFALVTLRGAWGWSIFGVIWGLAILGIVLDSIPKIRKGKRIVQLSIHLIMGWLILVAMVPLVEKLTLPGCLWLLLGGVFYTAGVFFYVYDRIKHFHGIWHLFVLAGSVTHYFTVLHFVL